MAKFNLKDYQKTDGDEHIDARLEKHRSDTPEFITEKQLVDESHVDEQDQTIEKQLDKVRMGNSNKNIDDMLPEGRFDKIDASFGIKHRNESAYSGDMNKLEEKRLASDPVEKEKYESSSNVSEKKMRWWENSKSPDGLKLASKINKKAQDDTKELMEVLDETLIPEDQEDISTDTSTRVFDPWQEAFESEKEIDDVERVTGNKKMDIIKQKIITGKIPGIYMVLEYNPGAFKGNEGKIRRAALKEVLSVMPELGGLIDETDFYNLDNITGTIKLRAAGPNFEILNPVEEMDASEMEDGGKTSETGEFSEISYEEKDVGGTMMAIGNIKFSGDTSDQAIDFIADKAVGYILAKHPDLIVEEESLDLSNLLDGEIGYMVAVGSSDNSDNIDIEDVNNSSDVVEESSTAPVEDTNDSFPIIESSSSVSKKK